MASEMNLDTLTLAIKTINQVLQAYAHEIYPQHEPGE